ncbi:MAG: ferrous iron transport protein B [Candidatus Delongbacteria bacterium]|nr:ferrous iron transport protein B [Candidatus Delongbacteria bacterium]
MQFLLVGQPNCGKSTIFNEIIGYKSIASNFPGATVKYTSGYLQLENDKVEIIDLPGTYSIYTTDEAELQTVNYLLSSSSQETVIINVVDSSVLSRSLELTIQLMELQLPMVVCLNMADEAKRKGISINTRELAARLGIDIIETIGRKGIGLAELFDSARNASYQHTIPRIITGNSKIEALVQTITRRLEPYTDSIPWNLRFTALKMIEKEQLVLGRMTHLLSGSDSETIRRSIGELEEQYNQKSELIIASIRHDLSFQLFEKVAQIKAHQLDLRDRIDQYLLHPFWGYVFMFTFIFLFFQLVFRIGNAIEPIFLDQIDRLTESISSYISADTAFFPILQGFLNGVGGGIGIVIPYLIPFFIILSFLEDTGYLARIAYLIDNIMHHIGLHGTSIVPIIVGYGCTVPAILATRILKSPRDKLITATLTTLVPCSARMTVILGLIGFFISPWAAFSIYLLNILVLGIIGRILSQSLPEVSPGFILEIPKYHLPGIKALLYKTWFRLKEFIVIAWPILIIGSILLELTVFFKWDQTINRMMTPLTVTVLGLPAVVGMTILFGIMRKELSLLMLFSALGTTQVIDVMSISQIFTYTIFVTFYIPCLATVAALAREMNWKKALLITLLTFGLAVILGVISRLLFILF